MLPAQPPNSRRRPGTRNDTFRRWILSGRIWLLNLSLNTMMVSHAIDPQINALFPATELPLLQSFRVRIYHMAIAPCEGNQRQPRLLRQPHRESRGSREGRQERNPNRGTLLHHLEARTAGYQHITFASIRAR